MKIYEVQGWEASVRSFLAGFDVREDIIDDMIRDDIYLEAMKKHVLEAKRKEMEGRANLILENAFREPSTNKPTIEGEPTMSPQYNPDPTTVSAFFYLFEKGDYLFDVQEGKPFEGTNQKGEANAGIRYPIVCSNVLEGDSSGKGKKQMFTCYIHSDGAMSFSKRFLMACLGYSSDSEGELRFNAENQGADWRVDPNPEAPYVGEMWKKVTGATLVLHASTRLNDEGQKQQQWNGFSPLSDA